MRETTTGKSRLRETVLGKSPATLLQQDLDRLNQQYGEMSKNLVSQVDSTHNEIMGDLVDAHDNLEKMKGLVLDKYKVHASVFKETMSASSSLEKSIEQEVDQMRFVKCVDELKEKMLSLVEKKVCRFVEELEAESK